MTGIPAQVPGLTVEDVADFIEAADANKDGVIDFKEFMELLAPGGDDWDTDGADDEADEAPGAEGGHDDQTMAIDHAAGISAAIGKIEPYGRCAARPWYAKRRSPA